MLTWFTCFLCYRASDTSVWQSIHISWYFIYFKGAIEHVMYELWNGNFMPCHTRLTIKLYGRKGRGSQPKCKKIRRGNKRKIKKPQVQKSNPITQHKLTKTTKPKQESISELQTSQKVLFPLLITISFSPHPYKATDVMFGLQISSFFWTPSYSCLCQPPCSWLKTHLRMADMIKVGVMQKTRDKIRCSALSIAKRRQRLTVKYMNQRK